MANQSPPPTSDKDAQPATKRDTQVMKAPSAAGAKAHDTITLIVRRQNEQPRRAWWLPWGVIGTVVLGLVILGLFLPPLNAYSRFLGGEEAFTPLRDNPSTAGLAITASEGSDAAVRIQAASADDYRQGQVAAAGWQCRAADSLPGYLRPVGTVYSLEVRGIPGGAVNLSLDLPGATTVSDPRGVAAGEPLPPHAFDVYAYDQALNRWRFVPTLAQDGQLHGTLNRLPNCLVTALPSDLPDVLGLTTNRRSMVSTRVMVGVDRLYPAGLVVGADGRLLGSLPAGATQARSLIPVVRNFEAPQVVDVATVESLLSNPAARQQHVTALVNFAAQGDYVGLAIDYRQLSATDEMAENFTRFLVDLSRGLHAQGQILVVYLPMPQEADGQWQGGAYQWAAIGQVADEVIIRGPLDPAVYVADGPVDRLLRWAVKQVNRYQLFLGLDVRSVEVAADGQIVPYATRDLAALLGTVQLPTPDGALEPGAILSGELTSTIASSDRDPTSHTTHITLQAGGVERVLWVNDAASLAFRARQASAYQLGGVVFLGDAAPNDMLILSALSEIRAQDIAATEHAPVNVQLAWAVRNAAGEIIFSSNDDSLNYTVDGQSGQIEVAALLNVDGQQIAIAGQRYTVLTVTPGDTITAASQPTATPTDIPPTTEPTAAATEAVSTPDATPLAQANTATPTPVEATSVPPTTPTAAPTDTPFALPTNTPPPTEGPTRQPTATFAPVTLPAPHGPVTMELGGQVEQITETTLNPMRTSGMGWVVIQVPYAPGTRPFVQQEQIEQLHEQGLKVMYIVVGQASQLDTPDYMRNYARFLSALSAFGADAIQVWYQPDSPLFWPEGNIDPAAYVELLREAARSIRASNPETLVVSAQLEPGDDDALYYQGMAAAGATDLIDCIGVRYTLGTVPPDARSGDPRGEAPHLYMQPSIEAAHQAFGGSRPVCLTIGYLSPEGYTPLPDEFAWASQNTTAQQADWLAQAALLNQDSANVRLMVVWNVDFTFFGFDAAAGYAIIRRDATCPACEQLGAVIAP